MKKGILGILGVLAVIIGATFAVWKWKEQED